MGGAAGASCCVLTAVAGCVEVLFMVAKGRYWGLGLEMGGGNAVDVGDLDPHWAYYSLVWESSV